MVPTALAVVLSLAVCGVLSVVFLRRAFPPAFPSPDELARWATRLNATAVQLTWWGGIRHVVIEPRVEQVAPVAFDGEDESHEPAEADDETQNAFDVFRNKRKRRMA